MLGDAVDTLVLGVWMPLCDTSAELCNGPIQMQRTNGHAQRRVLQHYQAPAYLVVDPEEFSEQFPRPAVTCDVPAVSPRDHPLLFWIHGNVVATL